MDEKKKLSNFSIVLRSCTNENDSSFIVDRYVSTVLTCVRTLMLSTRRFGRSIKYNYELLYGILLEGK